MDKVVLVTGCLGGIGAAICQDLSKAGFSVVGTDVRPDAALDFPYVSCDLSDHNAAMGLCQEVERRHGPIYGLVNNAGAFHGKGFLDVTKSDYDLVFSVNIGAMFFLTQQLSRLLIERNSPGSIVNLASIAGQNGSLSTDYAASKGAVVAFTKGVAKTLGRAGIRVNAVAPGVVKSALTDRMPRERRDPYVASAALGRIGLPGDIAGVVTFLMGESASYMTGAIVDVNGGL